MRLRIAAIIGGLAGIAIATADLFAAGPIVAPVPEIDAGSITTGLALLGASILMLRARRRSR